MPELPDITSYLVALRSRIVGQPLEKITVRSPFLVRTVEPDLQSLQGQIVRELSRIGKRIVWHFAEETYLVFHLMIAGRFHWKQPDERPSGKNDLAAFAFPAGTLLLTEASKQKRASLHVVRGKAALAEHNRGGLEPLDCSAADFHAALTRENHTLKRALADSRLFSGIGNPNWYVPNKRQSCRPLRSIAPCRAKSAWAWPQSESRTTALSGEPRDSRPARGLVKNARAGARYRGSRSANPAVCPSVAAATGPARAHQASPRPVAIPTAPNTTMVASGATVAAASRRPSARIRCQATARATTTEA
jgi:hypothetical protein